MDNGGNHDNHVSSVTVLLLCNLLQQASSGEWGVELISGEDVYGKQSPALVLLGPFLALAVTDGLVGQWV